MKKIYIEPQMEVVEKDLLHMICNSVPVEESSTAGEGGWGTPQSLDFPNEEFNEE